MATIVSDTTSIRPIALALASRGRGSRFGYLAPMLRTLEIGGMLVLDDNDLAKYDGAIPGIVAGLADGSEISKVNRAKMRNLLSALIRETRKVHGDNADLRSSYHYDEVYLEDGDEPTLVPRYGVTRIA